MSHRRAWLVVALSAFAAWVVALAYLAATSGEKPQARTQAAPAEPR